MILAIPTENMNGDQSLVYGHFGSAPYYAYYDSSDGKLDFTDNGNKEHEHGQCQPVDELREKKVEAVFCNGMGLRAVNNLNALGIKVYLALDAATVGDIVKIFKNGELKELLPADACQHHNCH
jgi:predicted Fe-Mo cluster-binding NifX family protein